MKHFDDLVKEIADRRAAVSAEPYDQSSPAYKAKLKELMMAARGAEDRICPDHLLEMVYARVVAPFSDCFWHEGCAAPEIR